MLVLVSRKSVLARKVYRESGLGGPHARSSSWIAVVRNQLKANHHTHTHQVNQLKLSQLSQHTVPTKATPEKTWFFTHRTPHLVIVPRCQLITLAQRSSQPVIVQLYVNSSCGVIYRFRAAASAEVEQAALSLHFHLSLPHALEDRSFWNGMSRYELRQSCLESSLLRIYRSTTTTTRIEQTTPEFKTTSYSAVKSKYT